MTATTTGAVDLVNFLVRRDDLRQTKFASAPAAARLAPGQALLRIDQFAFTSNNVTYGAFGDAMSYWNFFPARVGWGRIPVWGFGTVIASQHQDVKTSERFYGYYPMSSHVVLEPARVTEAGSRPEDVDGVIRAAQAVDGPALIWFEIAEEQNVFPMMPAGKGLSDLIEKWEGADE